MGMCINDKRNNSNKEGGGMFLHRRYCHVQLVLEEKDKTLEEGRETVEQGTKI